MTFLKTILATFVFILLFPVLLFADEQLNFDRVLKDRPSGEKLIFDYANILPDAEEYTERYLKTIRDRYGIEAMVVTVPSLTNRFDIETLAVEFFEKWRIGERYQGRGILLLLADHEKQVKLEISSELEDVFTDAFTGYAEDLQLRPHFLANQLGTGLIAVMEEMERRAQVKNQGEYTPDLVRQMDQQFLSQGGGAKRGLESFQKETVTSTGNNYPAGQTPEQAWQTMISSWRDKIRDPNLGVYMEMTKLAYQDYQNLPDSRYEQDFQTYGNKPFEIIQNENYAVVFFSAKQGWDNSPFLLCHTPKGWKFDIVHQRQKVRMGSGAHWGIERGDYPYMDLLSRCPYYETQDIPWDPNDIYSIENDAAMAEKIRGLLPRAGSDNFETLVELGRLATLASYSQTRIQWLNSAKRLNPDDPRPYKYLAISHVDMYYQNESAIRELKDYVHLAPDNPFGHKFLGYLYLQTKQPDSAVKELNRALELSPDDIYSLYYLAKGYGILHSTAASLDPRKIIYKNKTFEIYEKTKALFPDHRRVQWLESWLNQQGLLK